MPNVEHGFLLSKIWERISGEEWERDPHDDDREIRSVYLGTIFALTPSGKYYVPFACSNVAGCDSCKGEGYHPVHKSRRVAKRRIARALLQRAKFEARKRVNEASAKRWIRERGAMRVWYAHGAVCTACNGSGSREAYLDELWRESAESALMTIGCYLENGEGDSCDLFAVECRDYQPRDEDEDGN